MAPGEESESAQAAAAAAAAPPPLPHLTSAGGDGEPLVGYWSALFVALVAALIAWLWYGRGDGEKEEEEEAAAAGGSPQRQPERGTKEPNQRNYECLTSETKQTDVSSHQEPMENQLASSGEHHGLSVPNNSPETEPLIKEPTTPLMNYREYLKDEAFSFPATTSEPSPSQQPETHGGGAPSEAGSSSEQHDERCKEQPHHSVGHEEWEIVPEHLGWGSATRKSSVDDASSKDPDLAKRVAAVSPMPQTVHVTFRVHYITHSEAQLIAVTGDHECLGQWQHYVPLRCDKDGFWSDSVVLPVDTRIEWKFIVVENGKVRRWEECDNRTLMTEHEDRVAHKWWGYH